MGPKDIAESIIALAESGKYVGGTVLEVAKGQLWRSQHIPYAVEIGVQVDKPIKSSIPNRDYIFN